jgi:hypothetical protein
MELPNLVIGGDMCRKVSIVTFEKLSVRRT